jgi:chain length determinant protein tyrosine kinase EpsG
MAINLQDLANVRAARTPRRIGEILRESGRLGEQDIRKIVARQAKKGGRFGEVARDMGLIKDEDIKRALAHQFHYPYVSYGKSNLSPLLIAAYEPFSVPVEPIRALRSQLMLRWFGDGKKALVLTGASTGTGCSQLAGNLAIVFAQLGQQTLLIDADFRRPCLQRLFAAECDAGLSNVLCGTHALGDAVIELPHFQQLSLLCAGVEPPNPQELLSQRGFSQLLAMARDSFDIVIIDTPPLGEFADAQIAAARADGCVLTARRHQTRMSDVHAAQSQLSPSGATLLGTVIND